MGYHVRGLNKLMFLPDTGARTRDRQCGTTLERHRDTATTSVSRGGCNPPPHYMHDIYICIVCISHFIHRNADNRLSRKCPGVQDRNTDNRNTVYLYHISENNIWENKLMFLPDTGARARDRYGGRHRDGWSFWVARLQSRVAAATRPHYMHDIYIYIYVKFV